MIATTRVVMPKSRVRLSAGRSFLSREAQKFFVSSPARIRSFTAKNC